MAGSEAQGQGCFQSCIQGHKEPATCFALWLKQKTEGTQTVSNSNGPVKWYRGEKKNREKAGKTVKTTKTNSK